MVCHKALRPQACSLAYSPWHTMDEHLMYLPRECAHVDLVSRCIKVTFRHLKACSNLTSIVRSADAVESVISRLGSLLEMWQYVRLNVAVRYILVQSSNLCMCSIQEPIKGTNTNVQIPRREICVRSAKKK